jgi:hypothetical protein
MAVIKKRKQTKDGSCVQVLHLFAKYCSTRVKGNFLHMPNTCIAQEVEHLPKAKAVYCRRINETISEVQMVLYIDRHVSCVVTEPLYPNIPPQQLVYGPPPSLVSYSGFLCWTAYFLHFQEYHASSVR